MFPAPKGKDMSKVHPSSGRCHVNNDEVDWDTRGLKAKYHGVKGGNDEGCP